MKKLVLMIAMVVGVTAFAQEKKGERKGFLTEDKVERLTNELNLTAEQQAKVRQVLEKKQELKKAERTEAKATRIADNEAFEKEMKSILTEEQIEKYNSKKEMKVDERSSKNKFKQDKK